MKKINLIFVFALMLLQITSRATAVTEQAAQTIAINFFKINAPGSAANTLTASLTYIQTEYDGTVDYYVFDMYPAVGFVIVAGNDHIVPVLGYSTETSFNLDFQKKSIHSWMQNTARKIHYSIQQQLPTEAQITYLWNAYRTAQNPNVSRSTTVAPLVQSTWDQEPNYNQLCPFNTTDNQRAVTGCVATAMAQIMRYWSYPAQGQGSYAYTDSQPNFSNNYGHLAANFGNTRYLWNNMPLSITNANNSVDTLMYQCGVSVAMDYGDNNQGGSGAWVLQTEAGAGQPCSQYSYVHYFSYDSNTIQGVVMSDFNATDWMTLMQNELNANRVIQYEGDDANGGGGHTWVCDGYDANNMLHMNWGWSGQSDGYFAVTNLDGGNYNFIDNEAALIGIQPPPPFAIRATAFTASICPGSSTTLTATGPPGATFTWTPTTGLTCPTCAVTSVTPGTNRIYTVTADSAGITGSATVAISITPRVQAQFVVEKTNTCSTPSYITFNNASANATTYIWSFGDGTIDTTVNPVHSYTSYGTFNVQLIATNACGVDTLLKNQVVEIHDLTPVITPQSVCQGQAATLSATSPGEIRWYDAVANGNLLDTGNTFTTPVLNNPVTYYVSATIPAAINKVGPADNTFGAGGYFAGTNKHSVIFNCTSPQTLLSVDVYAQAAGSRTIQLQDSNGTQLQSVTVNIPAGQSTVTLNMPVPVDNELYLAISGNTGLYRNNAATNYPFISTDSTLVITGSDAGTPGYFYFFYNWRLQQSACITTPVPVVAGIITNGSGTFNAIVTGTQVNFNTQATGVSYNWSFGDGSTSSVQNPSHSYANTGTYTVQLIEANGNCTDTITQTITTNTLGVDELNGIAGFSVYPNPAKEELTLKINTNQSLTGSVGLIYDILGQEVANQSLDLAAGASTIVMKISALTPGVYFIVLHNDKTTVTRKFVKAE